jgi:hypothetical protein
MSGARVQSTLPLTQLQAALHAFAHGGKNALGGAALEIQRVQGWLEDQLQHWQAEIRRAEDAVLAAKSELARRRWMKFGDRPVDCSEQEKALRKAQARLEHAEEKKARTRAWLRDWPDAVTEYEGQARPMLDALEHDVPRMTAWLARRVASIEAYARTAPPTAEGGTP